MKCTYGPRIRAILEKWYGFVHNTEQPAAASGSKSPAESVQNAHRLRLESCGFRRAKTQYVLGFTYLWRFARCLIARFPLFVTTKPAASRW